MRVVATLLSLADVHSFLCPLGLWEPFEPTSVQAPRAPPSTVRWMVDSVDGQVIDLDPNQDPYRMPNAQRYPWPKERFRYEQREP
jgi:hypothetical protein